MACAVRKDPRNPEENEISTGVSEKGLVDAINKSGYPLQGIVADEIQSEYNVTEEWGYIDRDTEEHRSLDLFGWKTSESYENIFPTVALLVECKRSIHPYVFFKNVVNRDFRDVPRVAGLTKTSSKLFSTSGPTTEDAFPAEVIGLTDHSFIADGPANCASFSRATIAGKKAQLSGATSYNSLLLPLVKAIDHCTMIYKPQSQPNTLRPVLVLGLSVLDAPMILVESPETASDPVLTPWIRVSRQESQKQGERHKTVHYSIDCVHVNFLPTFLQEHLNPFTRFFFDRALKMSGVFFRGGRVENINDWSWEEVEPVR